VEADLTGGAVVQLWDICRRRNADPPGSLSPELHLADPLSPVRADCFISVNLLSQLDTMAIDYMKSKGCADTRSMGRWRRQIQEYHLQWITAFPGCLVTDTREIITGKMGEEKQRQIVHARLPGGIREKEWEWAFDSAGMYHPGATTRMVVRAMEWP
jgi:hypothetical protein